MGAELSFIGTKLSAHYSQLQSVSIGLPLAAADLVVGLQTDRHTQQATGWPGTKPQWSPVVINGGQYIGQYREF